MGGHRSGSSGADRRWEHVANSLRVAIASGELRPSDQLPTAARLMEVHGVSRQTVQTAAEQLRREGLLESRTGRGWFVSHAIAVQLLRTSTNWRERNGRIERQVDSKPKWKLGVELHSTYVLASRSIATDLGVEKGSELYLRERFISYRGQVLQWGRTYLPRDITRGTSIETAVPPEEERGTYTQLREAGHRTSSCTETVTASLATEHEASVLKVSRSLVVVRIKRIAHGQDRNLEVDYLTARASHLQLAYKLSTHE